MKKRERTRRQGAPTGISSFGREIAGLVLFGVAVFVVISLVSYSPQTDPGFFHRISPRPASVKNLGGPIGSYLASLVAESVGLAGYLVPFFLFLVSASLMLGTPVARAAAWRLPLAAALLVTAATFVSLASPHREGHLSGGLVGTFFRHWMLLYLHRAGAYLVVVLGLLVSVMALLRFSLLGVLRGASRAGRWALAAGRGLVLFSARAGAAVERGSVRALDALGRLAQRLWADILQQARRRGSRREGRTAATGMEPEPVEKEDHWPIIANHCGSAAGAAGGGQPALEHGQVHSGPAVTPFPQDQLAGEEEPQEAAEKEPASRRPRFRQAPLPFVDAMGTPYQTPPLDLLDDPDPGQATIDHKDLIDNARVMEQKLRDFGVEGKVTEVHPGPIITLYEYEPAPGVKVNRIVTLSDDLAMALKAVSVRIVAPIPGKSVVGIEVPNPVRQKVYLKEILASETFQSASWKLPLALGKDIAGRPIVTDLSRMPHLLIAGATGTGKSVCLHSLILSLLFRFSPVEVRFLMIDPKMLELTSYQGIPHLLHPVITDPRKASDVLEWAVERMEQRYQLLSEKGVRNIETYNAKLGKDASGSTAEAGAAEDAAEAGEDAYEASGEDGEDYLAPEQGPLPYIVIVIDEMADLMIISGRQIEEAITRLAQMARAAGIHLLLATQRPSVDVLTGIIKANLPTRISFQVSSRIDSRTILDTIGAEKLLGQGDMLFLPPGTSKVRRIHGAYVHEAEIERVVEFLKRYGKPRYERIPFHTKKVKEDADIEVDEKYDEAVQLVAETRQASISMIQRRLRVGYNRAARMIEKMEQDGIVGPQEGVKPREVLIQKI